MTLTMTMTMTRQRRHFQYVISTCIYEYVRKYLRNKSHHQHKICIQYICTKNKLKFFALSRAVVSDTEILFLLFFVYASIQYPECALQRFTCVLYKLSSCTWLFFVIEMFSESVCSLCCVLLAVEVRRCQLLWVVVNCCWLWSYDDNCYKHFGYCCEMLWKNGLFFSYINLLLICFQLWSNVIRWRMFLTTVVNCFPSLSTVVHRCAPLPSTVNSFLSLSISVVLHKVFFYIIIQFKAHCVWECRRFWALSYVYTVWMKFFITT